MKDELLVVLCTGIIAGMIAGYKFGNLVTQYRLALKEIKRRLNRKK